MEVSDFIHDINDSTYLPGLQREYVWSKNQVEQLFDSLMREYPVGIITMWDSRRAGEDFNTYRFISNYVGSSGRIPDFLNEDGYRRYNSSMEDADPEYLVIDGQQRLTSLNIGLFGRITKYTAGQGGTKDEPTNWSSYVLCINLIGHPDFDEENLSGDFEFSFKRTSEFKTNDRNSWGYQTESKEDGGEIERIWFPLPKLMDKEESRIKPDDEVRDITNEVIGDVELTEDKFNEFKDVKSSVINKFRSNVINADIPTKEVKKDSREIKEIFQRMNIKGEEPTPYQILLSQMMSTWPYMGPDNKKTNPRELVKEWVPEFQEEYPTYQNSIDREVFMRYSCHISDLQLKKDPITDLGTEGMKNMREKWYYSPQEIDAYRTFEWFKGSLKKALDSLVNIGFTEDTMGTMPIVSALAKFYYYNPDADPDNQDNLNEIYRFISLLLLYKETKKSLSRVEARKTAEFLEDHKGEYEVFPAKEAFDHLEVDIARDSVRKIVENSRYPSGQDETGSFRQGDIAAILGLSNGSYTDRDVAKYQVDHIFPSSRSEEVREQSDLDDEEFSIHRIGNLQLIEGGLNNNKDSMMPKEWVENTLGPAEEERIRRKNLYKNLDLDPENYKKFVETREAKIVEAVWEEIRNGGGQQEMDE